MGKASRFCSIPVGCCLAPNAALDVSGSFHVSTANFLQLLDGPKFFTHLGQESGLTVASPGEVGFSSLELLPELQVNGVRLGRVELSQGAFLGSSGNKGGTVLLRSGRLQVDGALMFAFRRTSRESCGHV
jgi:hypothetical protein